MAKQYNTQKGNVTPITEVKKKRYFKLAALSVASLAIVITAAALILINSGGKTVAKDSDLAIPLSEVSEKARFYPVEIGGTKMEVLAVKASDNTVRTAFNTCQVCFASGRGYYVQEGNYLVCQNCGNRFSTDDVEVTRGGCNPVPITSENKTVDGGNIIISKEFLAQAKEIFSNWKK